MNLPFSQHFPWGAPTHFAEKILKTYSLLEPDAGDVIAFYNLTEIKGNKDIYKEFEKYIAKIHTIREDEKNRWRAGQLAHCIYNNRRPDRYQFCPIFDIKGIQKIEISWFQKDVHIKIDGRELDYFEQCELAMNDGFDNRDEFLKFFNSDFKGKILHFTDFKYEFNQVTSYCETK